MPPFKKSKRSIPAPLPWKKTASPPNTVWAGPERDSDDGGITFSLLCKFLNCRERFRLLVIEGLQANEGFNHRLEYGNMWHVCEEALWSNDENGVAPHEVEWLPHLLSYANKLASRYPFSRDEIDKWLNVCKVQFPIYLDYWRHNSEQVFKEPVMREKVFRVPYILPSGRTVWLRGKCDGADLVRVTRTSPRYLYLAEHKTKGDIQEDLIRRQLGFDLQTGLYLTAMTQDSWIPELEEIKEKIPLKGVRYNVIRRPLSGGKGNIVRHKAKRAKPEETWEHYYGRLAEYIREEPGTYFMRWTVDVLPAEIRRFRQECLDPILETVCNWWDWVRVERKNPFHTEWHPLDVAPPYIAHHWRHPFGVYNPLDEGGSTDLDEYLATGSEAGLTRTDNLFPELQ